jgi:hypothetical protein
MQASMTWFCQKKCLTNKKKVFIKGKGLLRRDKCFANKQNVLPKDKSLAINIYIFGNVIDILLSKIKRFNQKYINVLPSGRSSTKKR